jgi:hypothetical protein
MLDHKMCPSDVVCCCVWYRVLSSRDSLRVWLRQRRALAYHTLFFAALGAVQSVSPIFAADGYHVGRVDVNDQYGYVVHAQTTPVSASLCLLCKL